MKKEKLQIRDLSFELTYPDDEEILPALEIENITSAILVKVEVEKAIELRELLDRFIEVSHA
jgi:hypothetical protein